MGPRLMSASSDVRGVLDAFRRIVQALRVAGLDAERRVGLSSAQLFALQLIAEHPSISINDLAKLTFTHQSSVSVVVQRLVARHLVAKVRWSGDRRRRRLDVTPAGSRLLRRAPVAMQEQLIAAVSALGPSDRRTLARSLTDIARLVGAKTASLPASMLFEDTGRGARRGPRSSNGG